MMELLHTELYVIVGGGISNVLQELGPPFKEATGHKLAVTYGGTPALQEQLSIGTCFDLLVVPLQVLADPASKARVGPMVALARVSVGVGVPAGPPKPDISTAQALRQALLKAKAKIARSPREVAPVHVRPRPGRAY